MPGPRQPTDLVIANGRKHLSKTEEHDRRQGECRVPTAKKPKPPPWLNETLRAEFRKLGKALIAAGLYTDLDADTLGMYLTARHQWEQATQEAENSLAAGDIDASSKWSRTQDRYFRAARSCASDLGLSVSARCRLVIPGNPGQPADDAPEDEFTKALREKQRAAMG